MELNLTNNRLVLDGKDLSRLPRGIEVPSELTINEAVELAFRLNKRRTEIGQVAQSAFFNGRVDMTSAREQEVAVLRELSISILATIAPVLEHELAEITMDDLGIRNGDD